MDTDTHMQYFVYGVNLEEACDFASHARFMFVDVDQAFENKRGELIHTSSPNRTLGEYCRFVLMLCERQRSRYSRVHVQFL
jgi:hypothetical protein